jgi:S-adenosylmethionine:tRNA-ribosyltransferase-isomerase (queuine synthetase)
VDNISIIQSGKVIVEGRQIKAGRTICFSEGTIKDENGKILAHGISKVLVTNGLQTINQAVMEMGYEPLPPKFIV